MKKISSLIVSILFFMLAACSAIIGESDPDDEMMPLPGSFYPDEVSIEGTPNQSVFSVEGGYFVWKNRNTFSVRVANPTRYPVPVTAPFFTGTIQIEGGTIQRVRRHNIGSFDDIGSRATALNFRIELKHAVSGFDFEVQPMGIEYCVLIDLRFNGAPMPGIVHLGRTLRVPDVLPLNICFR